MIRIAERYAALVEDSRAPLGNYLLTFVGFVTLRNLLEVFSDRTAVSVISFESHVHYYLFYVSVALSMILLFSSAAGESPQKPTRLILTSFFFILLAPVFDLLISRGQGYDMTYLLPDKHTGLLWRYLTFGGTFEGGGITIGQKLEGVLLLAASFLYLRAKKASLAKSLVFVLLIYTVVFVYAIVPFVVKALLDVFGLFDGFSHTLLCKFYLVLATAQLLLLAWRWNRDHFVELLKGARPFRQLHAMLMLGLGVALGPSLVWGQDVVLDIVLLLMAIGSGCLYVIVTNELADWANHPEPGPATLAGAGDIPLHNYRRIAVGAGLLALVYAGAVSYYSLFTILLCMGVFSIYSLPPLRIKRIPLLSKMPAAIGTLACVILGYVFAGGEIAEFDPVVIMYFLVVFALASNLIDIKDYEEDERAGIRTLPVLLGVNRGKLVIGVFLLLAHGTAPFALGRPGLFLPALGLGIVQFWLVNRRHYQEMWVFGLYLLSLAALLVVLI